MKRDRTPKVCEQWAVYNFGRLQFVFMYRREALQHVRKYSVDYQARGIAKTWNDIWEIHKVRITPLS